MNRTDAQSNECRQNEKPAAIGKHFILQEKPQDGSGCQGGDDSYLFDLTGVFVKQPS